MAPGPMNRMVSSRQQAYLDAMEIGVSFDGAGQATQIWAEVYYTP